MLGGRGDTRGTVQPRFPWPGTADHSPKPTQPGTPAGRMSVLTSDRSAEHEAQSASVGARRYEGFGSSLGRVPTMAHLPQCLGEASSGPNVLDDPPEHCRSLLAGLW